MLLTLIDVDSDNDMHHHCLNDMAIPCSTHGWWGGSDEHGTGDLPPQQRGTWMLCYRCQWWGHVSLLTSAPYRCTLFVVCHFRRCR